MSGAIHPLPQCAFMVWCLIKAQGQLYFLPFTSMLKFCVKSTSPLTASNKELQVCLPVRPKGFVFSEGYCG
jgi:hypothetical protein